MPSTTVATAPLSHYEALSTLWAAAHSARGTDLRGKSLVNLDVLSPVPDGLVADLGSKLRPAGIEYGLGQAGAGQCRRIDVTDTDAPVLAHEPRGQLVQEVPAAGGNLRVDGPHTRFASGTLCTGECPLVLAVDAWGLDHLARGEHGQGFQAQIDSDLPDPMLAVLRDFDLKIQVPAAAGIFGEAAAEDPAVYGAAEPEAVSAPEEQRRIALQSDGPRRLEGDPSRGFSTAPSRPLATGIPGDRKLLAHCLHGIRVQTEQLAAAASEIDQIKARGPASVVPPSSALDLTAIVPDPVHLPSLSAKVLTGGRILDPVPVREHHSDRVVGTIEINNPDAEFSCVFAGSICRPNCQQLLACIE